MTSVPPVVLVAIAIFSGPATIAALVFLIYSKRVKKLRITTVAPFGIYGGIALARFHSLRVGSRHFDSIPGATAVLGSEGLHGVVGIMGVVWAFIAFSVTIHIERKLVYSLEASRRSRGYFYLIVGDAFLFICIAVALGLGGSYLPTRLDQCSNPKHQRLFEGISEATGENWQSACGSSLMVQVMGGVVMVMMVPHSLLLRRVQVLPMPLRLGLISIVRMFRGATPSTTTIEDEKKFSNKDNITLASRGQDSHRPTPPLAKIFEDDSIAERIFRHVHYSDVVRTSLACKSMRAAIFKLDSPKRREARVDLICETSCTDDEKSECWTCARIMCKDCKVERHSMPHTQTNIHASSCHAICTTCYIHRNTSSPAPFTATLHPDDLSLQHHGYWCRNEFFHTKPVDLCGICGPDPIVDIVAVRERREQMALRFAVTRSLNCAICYGVLPREAKRRWICTKSHHDCHWIGHRAY